MRGKRPLLLDLFCGAGGCSEGYRRAGFEVFGVDKVDQPNYTKRFTLFTEADWRDGLEFWLKRADVAAIHASPPCQRYSSIGRQMAKRHGKEYPDLIEPVREALEATGLPYVIENVPGAPLEGHITLCGSMFDLDVRRHRGFEANWPLSDHYWPCRHNIWAPRFRSLDRRLSRPARVVGVHGSLNYAGERALREQAMGVDWMTTSELAQAIPPAYTEFIGRQLLHHISSEVAA